MRENQVNNNNNNSSNSNDNNNNKQSYSRKHKPACQVNLCKNNIDESLLLETSVCMVVIKIKSKFSDEICQKNIREIFLCLL